MMSSTVATLAGREKAELGTAGSVLCVRADSFTKSFVNGMDTEGLEVYRWDFNVFDFARKAKGNRVLLTLVMVLLEDFGLLHDWKLDPKKVAAYFCKVEELYRGNPYHNKTHAADVTQTAAVIMQALDRCLAAQAGSGSSSQQPDKQEQQQQQQHDKQASQTSSSSSSSSGTAPPKVGCFVSCCGGSGSGTGSATGSATIAPNTSSNCCSSSSSKQQEASLLPPPQQQHGRPRPRQPLQALSKLEAFAIIFASAVHDLGHPGVNNAFLIKTRDEQALLHNDRSVNENMHASLAFQLALSDPALNLFEGLSQDEYEQMRRLVLDMVLSTDMDVHFALLKRFDDAVAACPDITTWGAVEQRSLLFQMLVHLADLANPSRPWDLALTWAEWVVTEFLGQGAREAAAGIPVSDFCNKEKVCMPNAQLFFIERFMQPTLETFRPAAPAFYAMALPWLQDTKAKWQAMKDAGVRLPHQDYPALPPLPGSSVVAVTIKAEQQESANCCCGDADGKQ